MAQGKAGAAEWAMARKLRVEFAGAVYHVINRGNYRRDLFAPAGAAGSFVKCLYEACAAHGWRLHAYVVMRNHFHLALETPEPNLSVGMKWLQGTWATRFNRFRGVNGRPFQGRYKALHVEPGESLAQVVHYIHLNPVRAGIVPADRLLEYKGSSLPQFVRGPRPPCLEPSTLLRESGGLPDTAGGWQRYLDYLAVVAEEEVALREQKFSRLSRGWIIGTKEFARELKERITVQSGTLARFELLGSDRRAHEEARAMVWEERLAALASALSVRLNKLPPVKSAREKVCLAAAMKLVTSVSNRWLAERLQMGKASSIGSLVRRFRLAGNTEAPAFQAVVSRFTT